LAGYRDVLGTLWPISDALAVNAAAGVTVYLNEQEPRAVDLAALVCTRCFITSVASTLASPFPGAHLHIDPDRGDLHADASS
jgi:hypothetical protein